MMWCKVHRRPVCACCRTACQVERLNLSPTRVKIMTLLKMHPRMKTVEVARQGGVTRQRAGLLLRVMGLRSDTRGRAYLKRRSCPQCRGRYLARLGLYCSPEC